MSAGGAWAKAARPGLDDLLREGLESQQLGQLGRAERRFRAVLARAPRDAAALHCLALLLHSRARRIEALALMHRAAEAAPNDPVCQNNLANMLNDGGALIEAEAAYRRALALDPGYHNARFNLGECLYRQGRFEDAVGVCEELAAALPHDPSVWRARAAALIGCGRERDALAAAERGLALAPDDADLLNELGRAQSILGDFDAAVGAFRRALDLDPTLTAAALNLVASRRVEAPGDEDVVRIERLLGGADRNGNSDIADLHFALGKVYDDAGDYSCAFVHYRDANRLARGARFDRTKYRVRTDALIAAFPAGEEMLAGRTPTAPDKPRAVFVVGMPRSGTTLVEQILAAHPVVSGAGELPFVERLAAALSERVGTPYPAAVAALTPALAEELAREYWRAVRARLGHPLAVVTDKMPQNFMHLGLIAALFPGATIVHCRRDPLDVCLSIYFRNFGPGHSYASDLGDIGYVHREYRRLLAHWERILGPRIVQVDYERLVAGGEAAMRRLVRLAGLDWDPRCLDFHVSKRAVNTASMWQVRQPLYERAVGRWRNYREHLAPLLATLDI